MECSILTDNFEVNSERRLADFVSSNTAVLAYVAESSCGQQERMYALFVDKRLVCIVFFELFSIEVPSQRWRWTTESQAIESNNCAFANLGILGHQDEIWLLVLIVWFIAFAWWWLNMLQLSQSIRVDVRGLVDVWYRLDQQVSLGVLGADYVCDGTFVGAFIVVVGSLYDQGHNSQMHVIVGLIAS